MADARLGGLSDIAPYARENVNILTGYRHYFDGSSVKALTVVLSI